MERELVQATQRDATAGNIRDRDRVRVAGNGHETWPSNRPALMAPPLPSERQMRLGFGCRQQHSHMLDGRRDAQRRERRLTIVRRRVAKFPKAVLPDTEDVPVSYDHEAARLRPFDAIAARDELWQGRKERALQVAGYANRCRQLSSAVRRLPNVRKGDEASHEPTIAYVYWLVSQTRSSHTFCGSR